MIVRSKAPLRLGLAGGGTDVAPFSELYGGAILNATISDGTDELLLTFFAKHEGALTGYRKRLAPGAVGLFTGTVSDYRGRRQLLHPDFEMLDEDADGTEAIERHMRPVPIYPATAALPTWSIRRAVGTVLRVLRPEDVPDLVPPEARTPAISSSDRRTSSSPR